MPHPLTDQESDKYLQMGWTWAIEQVLEQWEEVIDSNKTDIQIIREFDKRLKAMRPQQQENNS